MYEVQQYRATVVRRGVTYSKYDINMILIVHRVDFVVVVVVASDRGNCHRAHQYHYSTTAEFVCAYVHSALKLCCLHYAEKFPKVFCTTGTRIKAQQQ